MQGGARHRPQSHWPGGEDLLQQFRGGSSAMNRRGAIKLAVLALLVAGVAALYFSPARTYLTKEHLRDLITWLRGLWYGPIVLIALYAAGCVLAIPASVFII